MVADCSARTRSHRLARERDEGKTIVGGQASTRPGSAGRLRPVPGSLFDPVNQVEFSSTGRLCLTSRDTKTDSKYRGLGYVSKNSPEVHIDGK